MSFSNPYVIIDDVRRFSSSAQQYPQILLLCDNLTVF